MTITVLYDNYVFRPGLSSGWGFSVLVDDRILFDTGENGSDLLRNMEALGRSPDRLEAVVISHNHWDHTGGLKEVLRAHPGLNVYIGPDTGEDLKESIITYGGSPKHTEPGMQIAENIWTTGSIKASYKGSPMPEQAMVLQKNGKTAMITGCSHPGVKHMIEEASKLLSFSPFTLLMGGFHWRDFSPQQAEDAAEELQQFHIETIVPTHCSGEPALTALKKIHKGRVLSAGSGFETEL